MADLGDGTAVAGGYRTHQDAAGHGRDRAEAGEQRDRLGAKPFGIGMPAGTERAAAIALAQKVALKSAYTVKLGKEAFYRQAEMSLADAYRYASEVMTENMMARDAEEGIGAFVEKREPKWQDK